MVAKTKALEGIFRPNNTLEDTMFRALRIDGVRFFPALGATRRVRRMSDTQRAELERQLAARVQLDAAEGRLKLPTQAKIVGGVLVTGWADLFEWFLENLPAILEMIASIMDMFS